MNIDSTSKLGRIASTEIREMDKKPAAKPAGPAGDAPSASARFSGWDAGDTSQDINTKRVAELRQAISEGRFEVDVSRIADGLIESARELSRD